ncbi:MAG: type II toxin-antitoxin system HicB family antitoxin [Dehalococcoidia bacterium]
MRTFTVILSPEPDSNWFSVTCPALPGAVSQGEGREAALRNIQEAMLGWLEVAAETGNADILEESPELIAAEIAFVLGWKAEEGWPLIVETAPVQIAAAVAA